MRRLRPVVTEEILLSETWIDVDPVAGFVTINAAMGQRFRVFVDQDITIGIAGGLNTVARRVLIKVTQDGAGAHAVSFTGSFRTSPSVLTTNDSVSWLDFVYDDLTGLWEVSPVPSLLGLYDAAGAATAALAAANAYTDAAIAAIPEAWPIGSVFAAIVSTNPATLLGYGTWSAIASGKVLVGVDGGDPDFDNPEETGGSKTVSAIVADHAASVTGGDTQPPTLVEPGAVSVASTPHSHPTPALVHVITPSSVVQPYFCVYFWKRTA